LTIVSRWAGRRRHGVVDPHLLVTRYAEGLKMAEVLRARRRSARHRRQSSQWHGVQIMRDFDGTMRFSMSARASSGSTGFPPPPF